MNAKPEPRRQQILEEIEHLRRQLESRQATPRPAPASVVHAYELLLARQYERLDGVESD